MICRNAPSTLCILDVALSEKNCGEVAESSRSVTCLTPGPAIGTASLHHIQARSHRELFRHTSSKPTQFTFATVMIGY